MAALAASADGLLIEAHNAPKLALCDSRQQITLNEYKNLFLAASSVAKAAASTFLCFFIKKQNLDLIFGLLCDTMDASGVNLIN